MLSSAVRRWVREVRRLAERVEGASGTYQLKCTLFCGTCVSRRCLPTSSKDLEHIPSQGSRGEDPF